LEGGLPSVAAFRSRTDGVYFGVAAREGEIIQLTGMKTPKALDFYLCRLSFYLCRLSGRRPTTPSVETRGTPRPEVGSAP
jgi:hypothetical protein